MSQSEEVDWDSLFPDSGESFTTNECVSLARSSESYHAESYHAESYPSKRQCLEIKLESTLAYNGKVFSFYPFVLSNTLPVMKDTHVHGLLTRSISSEHMLLSLICDDKEEWNKWTDFIVTPCTSFLLGPLGDILERKENTNVAYILTDEQQRQLLDAYCQVYVDKNCTEERKQQGLLILLYYAIMGWSVVKSNLI